MFQKITVSRESRAMQCGHLACHISSTVTMTTYSRFIHIPLQIMGKVERNEILLETSRGEKLTDVPKRSSSRKGPNVNVAPETRSRSVRRPIIRHHRRQLHAPADSQQSSSNISY